MKEYYNTEILNNVSGAISVYYGLDDIFKNTRERQYSDGRACFVKVIRDTHRVGWTEIQRYFNSRGKITKSHASIIHLYKDFHYRIKDNHKLESCYKQVVGELLSPEAKENVIERIRKIQNPNKFSELAECMDALDI